MSRKRKESDDESDDLIEKNPDEIFNELSALLEKEIKQVRDSSDGESEEDLHLLISLFLSTLKEGVISHERLHILEKIHELIYYLYPIMTDSPVPISSKIKNLIENSKALIENVKDQAHHNIFLYVAVLKRQLDEFMLKRKLKYMGVLNSQEEDVGEVAELLAGFDESKELGLIPGISIHDQCLLDKFVLSIFFQLASQWFMLATEAHLLAKASITQENFTDARAHSQTAIYACNRGLNFLYNSPLKIKIWGLKIKSYQQRKLFDDKLQKNEEDDYARTLEIMPKKGYKPGLFDLEAATKESKRSREYKELETQLAEKADQFGLFSSEEIKSDGNCLFSAIASLLKDETVISLKEKMTDHILKHLNFYQQFSDDVDTLLDDALTLGKWGDHINVIALSWVLKRTIVVIQNNKSDPTVIKQKDSKDVLTIGYIQDLHYLSLVKNPDVVAPKKNLQTYIEKAAVVTMNSSVVPPAFFSSSSGSASQSSSSSKSSSSSSSSASWSWEIQSFN
jgi:hypothetical protein